MNRILRLSDEVIGKIAAGEVVERPSAAVKELVENSLDAGASAVTVEIRGGGADYLRVTDNGSGIPAQDIRMAFERHATSKLVTAQQLASVATLGFRGEALASIAAVARVTCTTRTAGNETGIRAVNEGGQLLSVAEAACPEGTSFVVRDLFFNAPVRLKFLKKPGTEAGYVADVMMRMILSRPDVSFRLISDGKTVYHSAGDGKLESAVFAIYGSEMLRSMRKVEGNENGLVLKGYVGIGESGRSSRSNQSFFINGRYLRSPLLSSAVEEACRERVMIGKYPACVLHITMPYEQVDVNVHPNKLEVRFANEAGVSSAVENLVRDAIRDRDALERPVPMILTEEAAPKAPSVVTKDREAAPVAQVQRVFREEASPKAVLAEAEAAQQPAEEKAPIPIVRSDAPQAETAARTVALREEPAAWQAAAPLAAEQEPMPFLKEEKKPMKIIGTAFNTYILIEYENQLLMVDQHAVHERLLFDEMMRRYDTQSAGQQLLFPLLVSVTRREQQVLEENRESLERIGFSVEPFGEAEVSVHSVPMVMGEPQTKAFLHEVLDQLAEGRAYTAEKRRSAILQTACKHAVKGGEALSEDVLRDLVTRMVEQRVTPTCPHGRPLVVSLTRTELDKKFRRIQ